MTSEKDKAASKAKGARLREQIERLNSESPDPAVPPAKSPPSPREFIARRMRELAAKKK